MVFTDRESRKSERDHFRWILFRNFLGEIYYPVFVSEGKSLFIDVVRKNYQTS